jgi:hypothetical protein
MTQQTVYDVVADFGADPTGGVSSDAAFTKFIAAVKAAGLQPGLGAGVLGGVGRIPNGTYIGLSSYDLTKSNGFVIEAPGNYGAVLYADGQTGSSKPIFDTTGSNGFTIKGANFYAMQQSGAAPSVIPSCAILMASSSALNDSNRNKVSGGSAGGFFSSAALCMIGTTDNEIEFFAMTNQQTGLPVLNHSSNPDWYVTSPYVTITPGNSPCGENTFLQCEWHARNMTPGNGWASYFRNVYSVRWLGGNHSCGGGGEAHVLFQGTTNQGILMSGTQFWTETAPSAVNLFQETDGPVARLVGQASVTSGAYSGAQLNGSFPGFVWQ